MIPSTPPKGSLEELFRHHLLESEAAAVRPRPQVWEQVDNALLLAQNEKYRRRLLAYRWAVAASLLLAALAGGGWWRSQRGTMPTATLAQATVPPAGSPTGRATDRPAALPAVGQRASQRTAASLATATPVAASSFPTPKPFAIDQTATLPASANAAIIGAFGSGRSSRPAAGLASQGLGQARAGAHVGSAGQARLRQPAFEESARANENSIAASATEAASSGLVASMSLTSPSLALEATTASARRQASDSGLALAGSAAETTLATRWASLALAPKDALPASLGEVAVAPSPPTELARTWQYGLAYSSSIFQPNIDWTTPTPVYSSALASKPVSLARSAAAAEYRDNLRPGLGQRLNLWAARRLGNGRWSLRTGLELSQNTASSASSVGFVGEPVPDVSYTPALGYTQPGAHPLRRTSYRYRSVSVPAELRYANPLKTGFSFYGRVGAFVSALLNVRSEVEGNAEASRTYTPQSASSPYRPLSAGLRGGGGVQYRPAGHQWSLTIGPVAELGILSLNADPSQDFWGQQRPYSFGLEAGMELGRGFRLQ